MSDVKIQINSLQALERLIGGDSELEIQIRNSIVQEFSKKYLKGVATDKVIKDAEKVIKEYVTQTFTTKSGWSSVLKPEFTAAIENLIEETINNKLNKMAFDAGEEFTFGSKKYKDFLDKLDYFSDEILVKLSDAVVQKDLERRVDQKIKQKLGLI